MKLTPTQLDKLDAFILQKGIFYTEVREEILDHLACAVEEKMAQDPSLSFDRAIEAVYASFGIFGFLDMKESIQKRIEKEAKRYFWVSLRSFFSLHRIIIPIVVWLLAYEVAQILPDEDSKILPMLGLTGVGTILIYFILFKHSRKAPKSLLLHTTQLYYLLGFNAIIQTVRFSSYLHDFGEEVSLYGAATLLTMGILSCWATYETYQWGKTTLRPPQMTY